MCKKIVDDAMLNVVHGRQVVHMSVGDMLRKHMAEGTLTPEQSDKVRSQTLLDSRDVVDMISVPLTEARQQRKLVLVDGFPRSKENLDAFRRKVCGERGLDGGPCARTNWTVDGRWPLCHLAAMSTGCCTAAVSRPS